MELAAVASSADIPLCCLYLAQQRQKFVLVLVALMLPNHFPLVDCGSSSVL